jgi:hypothetical protein
MKFSFRTPRTYHRVKHHITKKSKEMISYWSRIKEVFFFDKKNKGSSKSTIIYHFRIEIKRHDRTFRTNSFSTLRVRLVSLKDIEPLKLVAKLFTQKKEPFLTIMTAIIKRKFNIKVFNLTNC